MLHQIALIDPGGVPIHLTTISRQIIPKEEFSLYSGLISALHSFGESLIGRPQIIDFGNAYLAMFILRLGEKSVFLVGIADKTDHPEAVRRVIAEIGGRLKRELEKVVLASGLVMIDEKIAKEIDDIVIKTINKSRRMLAYLRKGDIISTFFGTLIGLLVSIVIYSFNLPIRIAFIDLLISAGLEEKIAIDLSRVIFAVIWSLFTGISSGLSAARANNGATAGYIAIILTVLLVILVSPWNPEAIFAFLGSLVAWGPFSSVVAFMFGDIYDKRKLT